MELSFRSIDERNSFFFSLTDERNLRRQSDDVGEGRWKLPLTNFMHSLANRMRQVDGGKNLPNFNLAAPNCHRAIDYQLVSSFSLIWANQLNLERALKAS